MQIADREQEMVKQAVALTYNEEQRDTVPKVVAIGKGTIAEKIIAKAREVGVPIQNDPDLVTSLCRLELGKPIPPELYEAVARLLAFVLYLDGQLAREHKSEENLPPVQEAGKTEAPALEGAG
ncbi:MAG: EscU/YscU/HrcU family type III secretion system export apparatus switch protein [Bacillota bacterium]